MKLRIEGRGRGRENEDEVKIRKRGSWVEGHFEAFKEKERKNKVGG